MKTTSLRRAAGLCALLAGTALCGLTAQPAAAQTAPPPRFSNVDGNGVDLATGLVAWSLTEGTIGAGEGAVSLVRTWAGAAGWSDNWSGRAYRRSGEMVIEFGGLSDRFSISGSSYVSAKGDGATLIVNSGGYVYRSADGTIVAYQLTGPDAGYPMSGPGCSLADAGTCAIPVSVTRPNGMTFTLAWDVVERCSEYDEELNCVEGGAFFRFGGVTSSGNYAFDLDYATDTPGNFDVPQTDWYKRIRATFTNLAAPPSTLPTVTYDYPSSTVIEVTDTGGREWRLTNSASGLSAVRRPGASSDTATWTYGTNGVSSATVEGVTTAYSAAVSGTTRTTTITDALNQATVVAVDLNVGRVTSVTDPLSRTTGFTYDSDGRLTRTTLPEANYVELSYDPRGNVTERKAVAKPGSGLPDIVVSALYPPSCANPVTCNLPTSTTDARGNTTIYTYDGTHGGLLTVAQPAPTSGAVQPETRLTYSQVTAVSGQPVWLLESSSQCQTTASCAGGADEVKTRIDYDSSNLLPVSTSAGNGSGTLTATTAMAYDPIGNLLAVDGPLAGTADTVRFRYNAARERIGTVGPDPDGGGAKPSRAERVTIDNQGLVTKVERGTVPGQSDSDWTSFAPAEAVETGYDTHARPVTSRLTAGGTTYALTQTRYDALGRVDCTAQRMNPAEFESLPDSACALDTPGDYGPDRIAKTFYDQAGQVTRVTTALGTADEAEEVTTTYTPNGQVMTVTDAERNKTTYEYDGHDRLLATRYPLKAKGADASAPTTGATADYEQPTYELTAGGTRTSATVASFRNRAGETTAFGYDALGRPTSKDLPGTEPDATYGYDLLGRMISASQGGITVSFAYDALGRQLTQTLPIAGIANPVFKSDYDLAGRRTRLTWPVDSSSATAYYVDYDYLPTGDLDKVREKGATSGAGVLATFGYDDLGRRTSLTRGNGAVTTYGYDAVSRLSSLGQDFAGTANDLTVGFTYNHASQIVRRESSNSLYAWTGHGNGTTGSTANGLNQLASHAGATPGYDARGNLIYDGSTSYTYSSENLLTAAGASGPLEYDPLMRFYRNYGTYFVHDSAGAGQLLGEYYNGAIVARYVPGARMDEPLVQVVANGARTAYHADERGSVIAGSNDSGANSKIVTYDEYGRRGSTGSYRFAYTGQVHLLSDVYDYKNRNYLARLGRFGQTDRIGYMGSMNLYAYVGGDPVNLIDPSGSEKVCVSEPGEKVPKWRCVEVDQDGDGKTDDNDMNETQEDAARTAFGGFILAKGGTPASALNLAPYGKYVWGTALPYEKGAVRVASQFVGYIAATASSPDNDKTARDFRRNWNSITSIEANRNFGSKDASVHIIVGMTDTGPGYWIRFSGGFGYGDSRSMYASFSDLARALLHEPWHVQYPEARLDSQWPALHRQIDTWARNTTVRAGLGRCRAVGNFPGC